MSARPSAPTVRAVAAAVGLSTATVSRAFSRPDLVRPETVTLVADAAARLGYVPNRAARALSTGRHGNIAVVVPDIANQFFPPLIRAVEAAADAADLCVVLGDSREDPDRESRLVDKLSAQVDGIVLAAPRMAVARLRTYADELPLVLVNREVPNVARVLVDTGPGMRAAVDHLAALGHRRIGYVGGPSRSWSDGQRRRAVVAAAEQRSVEVYVVAAGTPTFEAGRDVVGVLLAESVTAAVAFDDVVAQGLLAGLAEHGRVVPRDFSVVGCDDVFAALTYPPLTTVSGRAADAGEAAVDLLLSRLAGVDGQPTRQVLGADLVVRATTGPCPVR